MTAFIPKSTGIIIDIMRTYTNSNSILFLNYIDSKNYFNDMIII